ncbi:AAA family ATPase [Fulvivirga maritima]|uniref:restriction endonuclease n=1 Tax=Fulvivirga maritima TaxID=2904247 RepID=UPI001F3BF15D|nr:restriction endonuclease [Fulvivirga maritima]UII27298.1 AAA family ATPase [Fulvivirga maritima]
MNSEIQFILEDQNPFKQGNCFERIVRDIIETHRYEVSSNVNYTGMELDLTCKHKDRPNETLYVECKAKDKVSSSEILTFESKVRLKKVDFGYFIRTKELEHQAKGLVDELQTDDRYRNLTFFEPKKLISLLQEAKKIKPIPNVDKEITKEILAVTHFGDFYILIIKETLGAVPSSYYLVDASKGKLIDDDDIQTQLSEKLPELNELTLVAPISNQSPVQQKEKQLEIQTVSEVQESENWFDYLPASTKHIVGRDQIRSDVFNFFNKALKSETQRRLFYLTGKSGWGKSSLVADIKGRSRNKYYKNRFYALAIDSRSALSSNFVALSFEKILKKAIEDGFIKQDLFQKNISFTSTYDLLSSESVRELLKYLRTNEKMLVLIFDQFEDIFRKDYLFESFYKFLVDISDLKENIIIGFSWKTEILIPSENKAYHLWQQAKEQAVEFAITEFGSKETNGIISQLEKSIGKLNNDIKRRIVESSQNYPWLTKKLCIHIYDQIKAGKEKSDLIDENLNIEELFNSDLEQLDSPEIQGLKHIAQCAYDGKFFEASDVNEIISEKVISSLRDKRLIIRSGLNYNIYWDIFRDYLVTGQVPIIGESYIIRSSVNTCLEIFKTFNKKSTLSTGQIQSELGKSIANQAIENSLIDLRNLGLIKKVESQEKFTLGNEKVLASDDYFKSFITEKFKNYSIINQLADLKPPITSENIVELFKANFKGYSFKDQTWKIYANYLLNWIYYSDLKIKNKIELPKKGGGKKVSLYEKIKNDPSTLSPRTSTKELLPIIKTIPNDLDLNNLDSNIVRDLALFGIVTLNNGHFELTEVGKRLNNQNSEELIREQAKTVPKIQEALLLIKNNTTRVTAKSLIKDNPNILDSNLSDGSKTIYAGYILQWAKFISSK